MTTKYPVPNADEKPPTDLTVVHHPQGKLLVNIQPHQSHKVKKGLDQVVHYQPYHFLQVVQHHLMS